jgi:glutamine amidotransferase
MSAKGAVIVDYETGNLGSLRNMLKRLGVEAEISGDPSALSRASAIFLPGVGAYDRGMGNLNRLGLAVLLNDLVLKRRVPVLGICLGMQLLCGGSEEGDLRGLGWIPGRCVRFREAPGRRVPLMGWRSVAPRKPDALLDDMDPKARFYFVHSYHMVCEDPADVLATSDYGDPFVCAVSRGNIRGVQFHPEKSLRHGMRVLENFCRGCGLL